MSDHARWADAAGTYVLGAMPEDEAQAFEAHLAGCAACRAEVDELLPAAEALPMSAEPVSPPAALKARIMAEVEREATLLRAAGANADRPPEPARRRRRLRFGGGRLVPAAAALLAAGALAGAGAAALVAGDDARTVSATVDREQAPQARAALRIIDGEAMLKASDLPAPPSGRVYQVWVMRPGATDPEPTDTLFAPRRDGTAVAGIPGDVSGYEAVLVTDEPMGGSDEPTRTPVLSVSPS